MLEEHEWKEMSPYLEQGALEHWHRARALYKKFTGFDETNPVAIAHHRLSYFGPPCENYGRLYRTPRAKLCVECGNARRNIGATAGLNE
jgi:hypothetical protein